MSRDEERVTELEIRYTHLLHHIDELNEVVTQCNRRIARLEKDNRRLLEMVGSFSPDLAESPDE